MYSIRVVQKLTENSHNSDLKKILTDAAESNPHIPNLINIATRSATSTCTCTCQDIASFLTLILKLLYTAAVLYSIWV